MYLRTSLDFRVSMSEIVCAEKLLVYLRTSPDFRVSLTEIVYAEKLLVYLRTSPDFRVSMTDSAEDDVNLCVSTGSLAVIAKGAVDDVSLCMLSCFESYG